MKAFLTILLTTTVLMAAPVTQVTLVNTGNPAQNDGKHFVGPYTLALGGQNVPVLCIDFEDNTKPGDRWAASVSDLGIDLGDTYHPDELVEYREEAYLYTMIIEPRADRVDIQHAAWAITDASYVVDAAAARWIAAAKDAYGTVGSTKFEIVSEVPGHAGPRRQEFLTEAVAPEPYLINLLGGLLATGLAILGRRRP
ncbi:MAG: hypothetical protein M3Y24_07775 [Acidobacteriota bacterium]|nr:hypothetical protein [Acidobacteriota bacterium]